MSTELMPRQIVTSTALVAVTGALAVVALLAQRVGGVEGYPTHPLASLALAAAALLADLARRRLAATGNAPAARTAAWLTGSLLVALVAAVLAIAAHAVAPGPLASAAVALWSVTWIPPLALSQLVASAAVRPRAGLPRIHAIVLSTSALAMLAGIALWRPIEPFVGVSPIAPDEWPTRIGVVGDIATAIGFAGLLLLPITLGRAAASSRDRSRMRLGVAAAGTLAAPLVVIFCLALAIARDPGEVDPSAGSVAFLVAVAAGGAGGAVCAWLIAGDLDARRVTVVVRIATLAVAALVVAAVGTIVVAAGWAPTAAALLVAALAVSASAAAWVGGGRLGGSLASSRCSSSSSSSSLSRPATPSDSPLTMREREVLALLADGSSNSGIAAQLVVSERTVDAHLRAIFTKLDLTTDPAANRRVLAARSWLESHARVE